MLSISEYRRLLGAQPKLRDHLLGGPKVDDCEVERSKDPGREVDL